MVLGDPGMPSYEELADWLTARVARALNMSPDTIDADTPLADYGIDSAASLALCADLEAGIALFRNIARRDAGGAPACEPGGP